MAGPRSPLYCPHWCDFFQKALSFIPHSQDGSGAACWIDEIIIFLVISPWLAHASNRADDPDSVPYRGAASSVYFDANVSPASTGVHEFPRTGLQYFCGTVPERTRIVRLSY
jgi:hypothetical protein